jgi:trehalose 6-phosphate synthase
LHCERRFEPIKDSGSAHLIPLAAELRPLGLTNLIGYFHHVPWPAPEVLGTLPGSTDLLRAIMDFNLVGV